MPRALLVAVVVFVSAFVVPAAWANRGSAVAHPVPSHTPAATQRLWERLVREPRRSRRPADSGCRPLRAVFYTEDDWLRLATKLAANASSCAQYYISIPPLAADKTAFRTDQAWRIRALGPNFHAVAEVNYTGWSNWVTANGSTFFAAGVEARRRMAAAGFDVSAGDSWSVNEFSSAVRAGTNVARQKVRDLIRGLSTGDGTVPQVKGVVFDIGYDQASTDLAAYKVALQNWYQDSAFWQDLSAYASDWSQEMYGDVRDEAVAGASTATRIQYLNDFLGHQLNLAQAGPSSISDARSFLAQANSPLANAAWMWASGFGYTNVPVDQMEDYVTAQVAALRSFDAAQGLAVDHFGFAWAPRMADGSPWTAQFTTDSGALIDRLAAAIHDSDVSPTAACGTSWCGAALDGAAFNPAWQTFATWSPTTLAFTTAPITLAAGAQSSLTIGLQTDGVAQSALNPTTITLGTSSPTGLFATDPAGPWTPTLTVDVPAGSTGAGFFYEDNTVGTAQITATAAALGTATQAETIVAPPPPAPAPSSTPTPAPTPAPAPAPTPALAPSPSTAPAQPPASVAPAPASSQAAAASPAPAAPPAQTPSASAPTAVRAPKLIGTERVGSVLRVAPPAWTGAASRIAYQWQRCTAHGCASVPGATGARFPLRSRDAGARIRVVVTATVLGRRVTSDSPIVRIASRS